MLLAFLLLFDERAGQAQSWTRRLQVLIAGSALYALIVAVWVLSMWSQDHTAPHRFLQHAAGQGTGAGVVLHGAKAGNANAATGVQNGYAVAFRHLFDPAFPASAALAISLLASGLIVAGYAFFGANRAERSGFATAMRIAAFGVADFSFCRFPQPDKLPRTVACAVAGRALHRWVSSGERLTRIADTVDSDPDCVCIHGSLGWAGCSANRGRTRFLLRRASAGPAGACFL